MISRFAPILALSAFIAGCATQSQLETASGNPEGFLAGVKLEQARNKVVAGCNDARYTVVEASLNSVVCSRRMDIMGEPATTSALMVADYTQRMQFTLFEVDGGTRISARQWLARSNGQEFSQLDQQFSSVRPAPLQQFIRSLGAT